MNPFLTEISNRYGYYCRDMKFSFFLILFFFSSLSYCQENYSIIGEAGLAVNIFNNKYTIDATHYEFKTPISPFIGVRFQKSFLKSSLIVFKANYIHSKMKFVYNFNEPQIPYKEKAEFSIIYHGLQLGIGYQKLFVRDKLSYFFEGDLNFEHNSNSTNKVSFDSESVDKQLEDTLKFKSSYYLGLGDVSNYMSVSMSFGVYLGKTTKHKISCFIDYPFGLILKKSAYNRYEWQYKNENYIHQIEIKGSIIRVGISYGYKIFKK